MRTIAVSFFAGAVAFSAMPDINPCNPDGKSNTISAALKDTPCETLLKPQARAMQWVVGMIGRAVCVYGRGIHLPPSRLATVRVRGEGGYGVPGRPRHPTIPDPARGAIHRAAPT